MSDQNVKNNGKVSARVYLIHGWDGNPQNCWFPWLRKELHAKGYEVEVPFMPGLDIPVKAEWLKVLRETIKDPDENTYLIGHSLGCQAIQRYLESLEGNIVIGGAILVAGWVNDPMWVGRTEEETDVIHDWYDVPKDYNKIKSHCKKFVSIYSTNDPFIPIANWSEAKDILGAKVVMVENKSHFDDEAGILELPEVLAEF